MTDPDFEREHVTSRSYRLRFRSTLLDFGEPGVEVTSLPNAWFTDTGDDLRAIAHMATEAADWLDEQYMTPEYDPADDVDVGDTQTGQGVP
jgi:hypothetical protein